MDCRLLLLLARSQDIGWKAVLASRALRFCERALHQTCSPCLQTTYSTCGPASSASLLQAFGQDASEQQLARESFTSKGGTEIWYLARAFRRRGFRTNFVIQSPDHIFPPVHLYRASFFVGDK